MYWSDLLLTASVAWVALGVSIASPFLSPLMFAGTVVATFAFYRGLCFMHEISHHQATLKGFEVAWNILFGVPLLMPSTMYVGVHQDHHRLTMYGTLEDPEYLPFGKSASATLVFALRALLIPAWLLVRGVLLVPAELLSKRLHEVLVSRASSFSMNSSYRRTASPRMSQRIRRMSAATGLYGIGTVSLAAAGQLPWRALAIWIGVTAAVSVVNALRTLAAHQYESSGSPMTRRQQLADSIDVPGGPWTELWAPVGLRYHALHHYFPGIPYHNLGEAYRRLVTAVPDYAAVSRRSLLSTLGTLLRRGLLSSWRPRLDEQRTGEPT